MKIKMTNQIWEKITIALLSALVGGAPGYFLIGPNKPNRAEVVSIIETHIPRILENVITDLRSNNANIDKRLSVMEERLIYISKSVNRIQQRSDEK